MFSSDASAFPVLLCIEGLDGAGKNVQSKLLTDYLSQRGYRVLMVDFPQYDSFFGKEIGTYLSGSNIVDATQIDAKSMSLWYAMDRWNKLRQIDFTQLDFVVFNRYTLSNAVYQGARAPLVLRDKFIEWIFELEHNQLALPVPDLYIFLDTPVDTASKLNLKKGHREYLGEASDVYERDAKLQECVREIYFQMTEKFENISIISCSEKDILLSPAEISDKILRLVARFMK